MSVVDCLRKSGANETFELHAQDSKKKQCHSYKLKIM